MLKNVMKNRPVQLRICLVLMVVSFVYNVVAVVGQTPYYADFLGWPYSLAFMVRVPLYAAIGLLIYMIYRGYAWGRLAWTAVYLVLLALFFFTFAFHVGKTPLTILLFVYVLAVSQIIAMVLLWSPWDGDVLKILS